MSDSTITEIKIDSTKCTGCRICQLTCSSLFFNEFNPSKAFIQIEEIYGTEPNLFFLEGCTNCGQCVKYCLYGALTTTEDIK